MSGAMDFGDRHRHRVVGAVVDEAMSFERAHGKNHSLDLRRHQLSELFPVQIVHVA